MIEDGIVNMRWGLAIFFLGNLSINFGELSRRRPNAERKRLSVEVQPAQDPVDNFYNRAVTAREPAFTCRVG